MNEMSQPELQEQLTSLHQTQAAQQQLLHGLVDRFEDVVDRFDRQERRNEERFESHEQRFREMETTKPPYANMIAFAGLCVSLVTVLGWLASEPTRLSVENINHYIERIVRKMDNDDLRERKDAERFAALESKVGELDSLNHHLHQTKKEQISRLNSAVFKKDWGGITGATN